MQDRPRRCLMSSRNARGAGKEWQGGEEKGEGARARDGAARRKRIQSKETYLDNFSRHGFVPDVEVFEGALCLGAPVLVGRDLDDTHTGREAGVRWLNTPGTRHDFFENAMGSIRSVS